MKLNVVVFAGVLAFVGLSVTPAKADSTVFIDHDASKTFCTPFNGTYTKLTTFWANTAGRILPISRLKV